MKSRPLICAAALALAACASLPGQAPLELRERDDFALSGRIVVREAQRAEVLRISWSHAGGEDRAHLETPMGQTIAEISLTGSRARADLADGRHFDEEKDVELARQLIGIPLPLRRFADWVRARNGGAEASTGFEDSGWTLAYQAWGEAPGGEALPALIEAKNKDLSVRLRVEKWTQGAAR